MEAATAHLFENPLSDDDNDPLIQSVSKDQVRSPSLSSAGLGRNSTSSSGGTVQQQQQQQQLIARLCSNASFYDIPMVTARDSQAV